jgi:hypothetical protein
VSPRFQNLLCRLEVPIVRCRDAGEIDAGRQHPSHGVAAGMADEWMDGISRGFLVGIRPASRPRGHGGQWNPNVAKPPVKETFAMRSLEEWPVRFVENHSHADHAGTQASGI